MIRAGAAMCAAIAVFAIPALGADAQFPPLEAYVTEGTAKNRAAITYVLQRCGALSTMLGARLSDSTDDPKVKMVVAELDAMKNFFLEHAARSAKGDNITWEQTITDAGDSMLQLGNGYISRLKATGNFDGNWLRDDLVKSDYKYCRDFRADIQAAIRAKTK